MDDPLLDQIREHKLTVAQLKDQLRQRGLKVSGSKAELEDRLRFFLTTGGQIVPGQKGRPRKTQLTPPTPPSTTPKVKQVPKQPTKKFSSKGLKFPTAPKTRPKVKVPPKTISKTPKAQFGPATKQPLPTTEGQVSQRILQISELKTSVIGRRLTVDQMKRELQSLGLVTTGNKEELAQRLFDYLNLIWVSDPTNWIQVTAEQNTGNINPIFDYFWNLTTESMLQAAEKGYYISFFDLNKKTYHTFQIIEVKRSPFGLVDQIVLNPKGYYLMRDKGEWKLVYQAQSGNLSSASTFQVSIAASLRIV